MNCINCGRDVPDSERKCPACGAPVPQPPSEAADSGVHHHDGETVMMGTGTAGTPVPPVTPAGGETVMTSPFGGGTVVTTPGGGGETIVTSGGAGAPGSSSQGGNGKTGPLSVGQQFGPRYIIVRILGVGGMGAVYQAWDAELGVAVALKVIRPEVTQDPVAARDIERRFKQELLLARQVTHKNVVRIHDLGEIDGVKYITMPFIDGEDLSSVLKKAGQLTVPQLMPLARQIAEGLAAAHEAGVVHRDLKPANIMIDGDRAVIMDFGIARTAGGGAGATQAAAAAAQGTPATTVGHDDVTHGGATQAGAVVGTVQYMAPEQAMGLEVDQRADIYAYGLMLYDMLVGHGRATKAESAIHELQERLQQAPPAVRTIVPNVPEALDGVISKCIEPDPAKRFQTTVELVEALHALNDEGKLRPIKRVVGLPLVAAVVVVLLGLSGAIWWSTRPPVVHDPVSVVIADFANETNDPELDGVAEQTMQLALEGAEFISAYDRLGIRRTLGVRPPDLLDQDAALQIAVQNGVAVVVSGTLAPDPRGYLISVQAVRAVTGEEILTDEDRAGSKDDILPTITDLAAQVRRALGDDESVSAQRFAMETLSARSLEVVRDYASAMEALSRSRFDEALEHFTRAVERDPDFGLAYSGMAIASRNLDRQADAEKYANEALSHLDGMTERERYRARGLLYMVTGDYQSCVTEYSDLIARYSADGAARNNKALCSTYLRDWPTALDEMRQVVAILPGRALYRENLALYLSYAGEFAAGQEEAAAMDDPGVFGLLGLAFAQLGQGLLAEARQTYEKIGAIDELGASYMASGLGDIAFHQGRYADAERILLDGARADLASDDAFRAAAKYAAVAHARLEQGRARQAIAAADQALETSQAMKIRFMAARVFAQAGAVERARAIAGELANEFQAEPRAYAKIIEGVIALENEQAIAAVTLFTEANALVDTWIGHFDLGRAYLAGGAYPQADSEFDRCLGRRGEAMALFLDEEPTWGWLPPLYYYLGRVREGIGSSGFADAYETYLQMRGSSEEDPRVAEVRKRLGR